MATGRVSKLTVDEVSVGAWTVPTEEPEADGTLEWGSTTIVIVECRAGTHTGTGYTYSHPAAAILIRDTLAEQIRGKNPLDIRGAWKTMVRSIRNLGRPGICSSAIAAVDVALWDLKAKILELPLVSLLGAAREQVPVYGSGGFTSYDDETLKDQLSGWVESGIGMVKMKVGREPHDDVRRVEIAREAIGGNAELFVDANGAYSPKQALLFAAEFADLGVSWFEEPVSSDDLAALRNIRDAAPGGIEITAGEYGYDQSYFREMLLAGAVDVMQPDATRCAGITGFMDVAVLCEAFSIPVSAHTAPSIHLHAGCAAPAVRHVEYFHDHVRIEKMFFYGHLEPKDGSLRPDLSRAGLGLELKREDVEKYRVEL